MSVKSLEIVILVLALANFSRIFACSIQTRPQPTANPLNTTENVHDSTGSPFQDEIKANASEIYGRTTIPKTIIEIDTKRINY